MQKDTIAIPLEPFTPEEEAALFDKLDVLSIPELENYIGSAQNSLRNRGLDPSWRPRVAVGLQRAEIVLVRETAAAALARSRRRKKWRLPSRPRPSRRKKAVPATAEAPTSTRTPTRRREAETETEAEAPEDAE